MNASYLLHPRAPLVFGTGRPMDFGVGGATLRFPLPGTVSGALRAAIAAAAGLAPDPFNKLASAARVGPPLLASLAADGGVAGVWLARPADAAYVGGMVIPLVPVVPVVRELVPADCAADFPDGLVPLKLMQASRAKPDEAPAWWSAAAVAAWLAQPPKPCEKTAAGVTAAALQLASRTHVSLDPATGTVRDRGLFRSAGVDFGPQSDVTDTGFALAVTTDAVADLTGHHRRVGGEGRPARLERFDLPADWPCAMPPGLASAKRIRLLLTSPAVFEKGGFLPNGFVRTDGTDGGWEGVVDGGVRLCITACALDRAATYSGWQAGGPGRAWRVVPAGTVYWCDVLAGSPANLWNQSLCQAPWRDNGWGHVLVGLA